MSQTSITNPNILTFSFSKDKDDNDYGECQWARFYLDLTNHSLYITSNCGEFSHSWCVSEKESFLQFLFNLETEALLEKISNKSAVCKNETIENLQKFFSKTIKERGSEQEVANLENFLEFDLKEHIVDNVIETVYYIIEGIKFYRFSLWADIDVIYNLIEKKYPNNVYSIAKVFEKNIKPKIKEMLNPEEKI